MGESKASKKKVMAECEFIVLDQRLKIGSFPYRDDPVEAAKKAHEAIKSLCRKTANQWFIAVHAAEGLRTYPRQQIE